jgi:SAM-dependent methyltransferase
MTDTVDLGYLDAMYRASTDPWHLASGWYETRKRALIMAALPRERFRSGFEPGCSVGELTALLAPRCDRLLSVDAHPDAVGVARRRVAGQPAARVSQMVVPDAWPDAEEGVPFDLVVLSEIGYYISAAGWLLLAHRVAESATDDGVVVACHWRRDFRERNQPTDQLHRVLDEVLGWPTAARYADADFLLDVWARREMSGAQEQGRS